MLLSSMYWPVLSWFEVEAQPVANSSAAANRITKGRFMIDSLIYELLWMTPLTTFTLSPTRHGDAVASVITRFEPSSKRTAISKVLVVLTCFSISLPTTPPATAPTTAPILRWSPSPTWWPSTPPTTAPPTAPTPLPAPLVSTSCTDCTTPHSRQTARGILAAACRLSAAGALSSLAIGVCSTAFPVPIHPIRAAAPAPQNTMRAMPAIQTSGCKGLLACVSISAPLFGLFRPRCEKKPRLRGAFEIASRACYCLTSLDPEISMNTWRSGCMQDTFFGLLASLHSLAQVVGWYSPRALVSTRFAAIPWLTR